MVRITGQRRPDRGTIGRSSANRDYRMSTYDELGDFASAVWVLSLSQVCMGAIRKTYARREVYVF